jgi:hypothetical protein
MEINKTQVDQFNRMRIALLSISMEFPTPKELKSRASSTSEYKKNLEQAYINILKQAKDASSYVRAISIRGAKHCGPQPSKRYRYFATAVNRQISSPSNTSRNEHQ